jgi:ferrochelatase
MSKTAIVLFNLGGPDGPESVKKFRINLFSDRAIIRAPIFIRFWLARLIAASSAKAAMENYARMGGKSPLLALTTEQAAALQAALGDDFRTFIAMRYWHPFAKEAAAAIAAYDPDRIVLLPLYPQFSTTTTGSSLTDWHEVAAAAGLAKPTTTVCCYFADSDYVGSIAVLVDQAIADAKKALAPGSKLRLLFSAHGLPESIVTAGDPYQGEVEGSVAAVMQRLSDVENVEFKVCYQSRATPQKWLSPSTIEAIEEAGRDQIAVCLVPIAFVSDHIETLVELDIENRELAEENHVPAYFRAAVPNSHPAFINALANITRRALESGDGLCSPAKQRACAEKHLDCPWSRTVKRVAENDAV